VAGTLAGQKRQRTAALRDAVARAGSPMLQWLGSNRLRILFLKMEKAPWPHDFTRFGGFRPARSRSHKRN
jgi:hypothetical protein